MTHPLPQFKAAGLAVVCDHARSPYLLSTEPISLSMDYDNKNVADMKVQDISLLD